MGACPGDEIQCPLGRTHNAHDQIVVRVDRDARARADHGGRFRFLDQYRTGNALTRREPRAGMHGRVEKAASLGEESRTAFDQRLALFAAAVGEPGLIG